MIRTDMVNRTNLLLLFLIVCLLVAFYPQNDTTTVITTEEIVVIVTEDEVKYYMNNDIVVDLSVQYLGQTSSNWFILQEKVGYVKSALENFSRLNLQKLIEKQNDLKNQVDECSSLQLNTQLDNLKQQLKYISNGTNITSSQEIENLSKQLEVINEEKVKVELNLQQIKEKKKSLDLQQSDISKKCDLDGNLLKNKTNAFSTLNNTIYKLDTEVSKLRNLIEKKKQSEDYGEELKRLYEIDQQQAMYLGQLFQPQNDQVQDIGLHNEILDDFIKTFNQGIKKHGKPTEEFKKGLKYNSDVKKDEILELQKELIQKEDQKSNYQLELKIVEDEIQEFKKKYDSDFENLKTIANALENLRLESKIYSAKNEELKKQEGEKQFTIKKLIPSTLNQDQQQSETEKAIQEFIKQNNEQDQICLERCISYETIQQQINKSYRRSNAVQSIQQQFEQLNKIISDISS